MGKVIPGAVKTIQYWAKLNGCQASALKLPTNFDFDVAVKGSETTVFDYPNCTAGKVVEFWQLRGSTHQPVPTTNFAPAIFEFLNTKTL
jgi:poly(3-hydroxybutyrate) depolymerase